jgi:hypothetical protein
MQLATTAAIPYNSTPADIQAKFSTIHDFVENNLRRLAPDSATYIVRTLLHVMIIPRS